MNSVQFQKDYRGFHALYFTDCKDRPFPVYLACAQSTKWMHFQIVCLKWNVDGSFRVKLWPSGIGFL